MSNQLFKKHTLPRLDRGISLLYVLVVAIFFLSFGCDSKPREHANSIQLNKWLVKHFNKKKEFFYKFTNLFEEDQKLVRVDPTILSEADHEDVRIFKKLTPQHQQEILSWFDETGWFDVTRYDKYISFYGVTSHTHFEKENKDIFRTSRYLYFFEGVNNKDNICSSKLKDYQSESGECQIILDENFVIQHWWETRHYEKNHKLEH